MLPDISLAYIQPVIGGTLYEYTLYIYVCILFSISDRAETSAILSTSCINRCNQKFANTLTFQKINFFTPILIQTIYKFIVHAHSTFIVTR